MLNFSVAIMSIIGLSVIAFILTLLVVKDVSKTLQKYEAEEDTLQNEILRSHDYETSSLKVNIRTLTWLYAVLLLAVVVISVIFILAPSFN